MMLHHFIGALVASLKTRQALVIENLALRQQLAVFERSVNRPRLRVTDRLFWVVLSRYSSHWRELLRIVTPDTVVRWHRAGFRRYWTWRSRRRTPGRTPIDPEVRNLIRQMQSANIGWGAPRIHGELLKLGIEISQATVSKYMVRRQKPPSQTWRTFLSNHATDIVAIDFLTVPTATFRVLYVLLFLHHERRHIVHFNVIEHPTSAWIAQQVVEAFPFDTAPRYLLRDHDGKYGERYCTRVRSLGIKEVVTAPRSPWQNPFVERIIGSIRRDCLDHVIVINERHLRRILRAYIDYYHSSRTHLSLNKDSPDSRPVESPSEGSNIVAFPQVGGLHHRYERLAA
ncbi:integrase core domain-containing protein [Pseudomonadota bacterium]